MTTTPAARDDSPGTLLTSATLTAADRCDRCGAAARVRAVLSSGGELLFCQHHANEYSDKLQGIATLERSALDLEPAPAI